MKKNIKLCGMVLIGGLIFSQIGPMFPLYGIEPGERPEGEKPEEPRQQPDRPEQRPEQDPERQPMRTAQEVEQALKEGNIELLNEVAKQNPTVLSETLARDITPLLTIVTGDVSKLEEPTVRILTDALHEYKGSLELEKAIDFFREVSELGLYGAEEPSGFINLATSVLFLVDVPKLEDFERKQLNEAYSEFLEKLDIPNMFMHEPERGFKFVNDVFKNINEAFDQAKDNKERRKTIAWFQVDLLKQIPEFPEEGVEPIRYVVDVDVLGKMPHDELIRTGKVLEYALKEGVEGADAGLARFEPSMDELMLKSSNPEGLWQLAAALETARKHFNITPRHAYYRIEAFDSFIKGFMTGKYRLEAIAGMKVTPEMASNIVKVIDARIRPDEAKVQEAFENMSDETLQETVNIMKELLVRSVNDQIKSIGRAMRGVRDQLRSLVPQEQTGIEALREQVKAIRGAEKKIMEDLTAILKERIKGK